MTARRGSPPLDIALYGGVVFAWGFTWLAQHYQVGVVAPEVSVLWRFVIAAPVMLAIAAIRGERLRFPLRDHLWLALLGLTLFCTNFLLFYYAAQWVTSGLLSVVFSLASIINVVARRAAVRHADRPARRCSAASSASSAWRRCSIRNSPAPISIPRCADRARAERRRHAFRSASAT